jgi:hypothetical protein
VTRKQALTLAAATDLALALVLSLVGYFTGQAAFGVVGLVLMLGAVGILIVSRLG